MDETLYCEDDGEFTEEIEKMERLAKAAALRLAFQKRLASQAAAKEKEIDEEKAKAAAEVKALEAAGDPRLPHVGITKEKA